MIIQTPEFWKKNGFLPFILLPLSKIYTFISKINYNLIKPAKLSIPVICVGNIVVGGSGKTPVCLALADILKSLKIDFHFLSRGYGRNNSDNTMQVDIKKHNVFDVGDEPLLLAEKAPCWVAKKRFEGGKLAAKNGAKAIVMDDGFQNPSIKKDISFLVIDGNYGLGNQKILPAGPLRETLEKGITRADAVIIIGEDKTGIFDLLEKQIEKTKIKMGVKAKKIPIFKASIKVEQKDKAILKGQSVFAFAGIARPEKFYKSLEEIGTHVVDTKNFPDHYNFTDADMVELMRQASTYQAKLVTTTKDFVRLPKRMQKNVSVLPIELVWKNKVAIKSFLKKGLL